MYREGETLCGNTLRALASRKCGLLAKVCTPSTPVRERERERDGERRERERKERERGREREAEFLCLQGCIHPLHRSEREIKRWRERKRKRERERYVEYDYFYF